MKKKWLDQFESFSLSREQKTIVRLGFNERLISTKEIFDEVGIVSEDYYRQLIESLRKLGILNTKLSKDEVNKVARKKRISKKSVPRYQIVLPVTRIIRSDASEEMDTSDYTKIFVGNLPFKIAEKEIERVFQVFGEISDITIPKDYNTNNPKGYAFVEFEKKESAKKALDNKTPILINGRKVFLQEYKALLTSGFVKAEQ